MNKVWDLSPIYKGFDDPAFDADMRELKELVEKIKNDKNIPLEDYVRENYDLTPLGIIEKLNLIDRNYELLAEGCHYREALV